MENTPLLKTIKLLQLHELEELRQFVRSPLSIRKCTCMKIPRVCSI
ncbi:MAG: hypothetical protein IPJ82_22035 [Lewinellaceae bacterium]|nr:hypothetical protein [Lewinellaceae bacterium]